MCTQSYFIVPYLLYCILLGQYLENTNERYGHLIKIYNRKINDLDDVYNYAEHVVDDQDVAFKINIALGYLLKDIATEELTFF